jgi:STE24 endopeptidase
VAVINALLGLPLSLYRTFAIEQRFGFNHTGAWLFVTDLAKSAAVTLIIGGPLIALILWLMSPGPGTPAGTRTAPLWWLYVWVAWTVFSLAMVWIYPALIAPLFNRFSPLADERLLQRIGRLLARTGFTSDGVFVMDGSRRSSHGNAYFTGFGRHKRIVFFDTLLGTLTPAEIEAVLAHELGHYKRHHVHKHVAAGLLSAAVTLWTLDRIMDQPWFYTGLGVDQPSNHAALLLFSFILPVVGFFMAPFVMYVTRRHEYEADEFAAHQADGHDLATALVKLYRENAATLTPDPVYSAFYDSHPPALARISRLSSAGSACHG